MMTLFNNIKVGNKLLIGFLTVALAVIVVAVVGYVNMKSIDAGITTMYHDRLIPVDDLGQVESNLFKIRGDVYKYIVIPSQRGAVKQSIAGSVNDVDNLIKKYRTTSLNREEKDELAKFDPAWAAYQKAIDEIMAHADSGEDQSALIPLLLDNSAAVQSRNIVTTAIANIRTISLRVAEETHTQSNITFTTSTWILIAASIFGVLLAIGAGFFISRLITVPLGKVAFAAAGIAKGDLDQKLEIQSRDEIGEMAVAFSQMITYLQSMAGVADKMAKGDLTEDVKPQSERDVFGNSFARMVIHLRDLVSRVAESANSISASTNQLALASKQAGDATSQIAATIQEVARGTNQQTESVSRTALSVDQMSRAIDGVAQGAQEQAMAVSQTATVMNQLSDSVEAIRLGAQEQTETMQRAGIARTSLAEALGRVNTITDQVAKEAEKSANAATDGAKMAAQSGEGMARVRSATEELSLRVLDLGKRSGQIGAIVETIDDIAAQTNLLALNAAIEAARAGIHGRGFAVVADEVRKLAERSATATKEITEMIRMVQSGASDAVEAMAKAGNDVSAAVTLTSQAGSAFKTIATGADTSVRQMVSVREAVAAMHSATEQLQKAVADAEAIAERNRVASQGMSELNNKLVSHLDSVSAVVEENTASTEEMAAGSAEVLQSIENIASVSEENSAAVEQVSASAEEMSAQVEEVSASVEMMNQMALDLKVLVNQFKISSSGFVDKVDVFKAAHLKWVSRVEDLLAGRTTLREDQVASHYECDLGKWYYGPNRADYEHLAEFAALESPHARLHEVVRNVVVAHNRGDRSRAEAGADEVRRLSRDIVNLLERLEYRLGKSDSGSKPAVSTLQSHLPAPKIEPIRSNGKKVETVSISRIVWDESLATGEPTVDEQHRKLISQINSLIEAMKDGKARQQIEPLLDYLMNYTRDHFGYEEDCMEKYRCPVAAANTVKHAEFVKKLEGLKTRYEREGTSSALALQVRQELGDWLVNHIRKIDTRLGGCIHQTPAAKPQAVLSGNGKG